VSDPGPVAPPPLPRSLYVETTSRCNSLCETCILTFGGREAPKDLGYPEFRRIVDQFPVLERVVLHGIGEPLLNRELPAMIEHAKARGAHVLFNTNAITLNGRWPAALVDAGLDEIRVSLDGSTAETYRRVRGVDPKVFPHSACSLLEEAHRVAVHDQVDIVRVSQREGSQRGDVLAVEIETLPARR
jgi:MoaA/NifB/PqqE/SkfB family radical SAM enzyme